MEVYHSRLFEQITATPHIIFSPWCMRKGYCSRSVCVCVCVCVCLSICYHTNCYIPCFIAEIQVSLGFPCCFQRIHCVDFAGNALFKSSGDIC